MELSQIKQYILPIILIIFIIIIYVTIGAMSYDITGVWVANPDFAEEAGINKIILYISDKQKGRDFSCYLYIENNKGEIIEDQTIILKPESKFLFSGKYSVQVEDSNSWSDVDTMNLVAKKNILTFYDKESSTVYAELFKDNSATEFSKNVN